MSCACDSPLQIATDALESRALLSEKPPSGEERRQTMTRARWPTRRDQRVPLVSAHHAYRSVCPCPRDAWAMWSMRRPAGCSSLRTAVWLPAESESTRTECEEQEHARESAKAAYNRSRLSLPLGGLMRRSVGGLRRRALLLPQRR